MRHKKSAVFNNLPGVSNRMPVNPSPRFRILLAVFAGLMLALSFPNYNLSLLGWVCFVPLLYALESCSYRLSYILGLITGITVFSVGYYWISELAVRTMEVSFPLNWVFVFIYAFSFGQVFGFISVFYCWLSNSTRFSPLIIFPIAFVTVFSYFPMLFPFHLGDGQWKFLSAVQPVEFTGIYGLDFLMVLAGALIFRLIVPTGNRKGWLVMLISATIIVGWLVGGRLLLFSWDREMESWPTIQIGIIQPNRPVSLSRPSPEKGFSRDFPLEMQLTRELVEKGAELVVWPEGNFFGYTFWENVRDSFRQQVASLKTPLIFHDSTFRIIDGEKRYFNSSLFLDSKGNLVSIYDKIKLVPFSEYLPFFESHPLFDWILGDYLDNLTPGKENRSFNIKGLKIVPRICYEPVFPLFVADSIGEKAKSKLILVQSQDGWFGESSQPFQHMAATMIRAVENRVPLLHVIQNGPSGVIQPNGRFTFLSEAFTRGSWVVKVPYHKNRGGSFFSRHPRAFLNTIRGLFFMLVLIGLFAQRISHLKH
jgi:apolipoprotein N-acyltransferase